MQQRLDARPRQFRMPRHEAIHARQEPADTRNAIFLPIQIAVRRRREQRIHARRIRPIARDHLVGRHHIALRLRHLRAVLDHHALREQPRHRLIVLDQPHVAHHLGPEARIDQVQDGVLHAADVLIDGKPVLHRLRVEMAPLRPSRSV